MALQAYQDNVDMDSSWFIVSGIDPQTIVHRQVSVGFRAPFSPCGDVWLGGIRSSRLTSPEMEHDNVQYIDRGGQFSTAMAMFLVDEASSRNHFSDIKESFYGSNWLVKINAYVERLQILICVPLVRPINFNFAFQSPRLPLPEICFQISLCLKATVVAICKNTD